MHAVVFVYEGHRLAHTRAFLLRSKVAQVQSSRFARSSSCVYDLTLRGERRS